ncbi:MAG: undecaprenyl-diphosphatase UppP [Bacteroidetes bacterium]|nr:undecaprenyl-diphosphatase UppP [Bacteroidota bacterium]MCH8033529.1 undecaprenyl-diphosphatase UppP [Bacteroidota bacterium]
MSILESIILGIVQGLSEFLPISSSAHLTLAGKLMNVVPKDHPEFWTAFVAVIQLGTLISILIYFSKDIINITNDFFRDNIKLKLKYREQSLYSRLGWMIAIGTIPIVIIGLGFKDIIEGSLTKNLYVISLSLIIFAIILAISERVAEHKRDIKDLTIKDSLIIGIAQSFALIPGASRSGTTITGGLFVGLKRSDAARFSFLLSIPAVFASGLLELYSALKYIDASMMLNFAAATVASAVSGYIAIDFLIKYLKKHSTYIFIFYRIVLGILIIVLLLTNTFKP